MFYEVIRDASKWSEAIGVELNENNLSTLGDAVDEEELELIDADTDLDKIDALFDVLWTRVNYHLASSSNHTGSILDGRIVAYKHRCKALGFDPLKVWRIGSKSNYAKFSGFGPMYETRRYYENKLGLVCDRILACHGIPGSFYLRLIDKEQTDVTGKVYYAGKLLKPLNWIEPNWEGARL